MKEWIKNNPKLFTILIILIMLLLPLGINALYLISTKYTILYGPSEWSGFWATYLAAIASFAMVFITWLTLKKNKEQNDAIMKQNKEQLDEMKRQWEEDHRPRIEVYFTHESVCSHKQCIEILNIGSSIAKDITVQLSDQMITLTNSHLAQDALRKLGNNIPFSLLPHESYTLTVYEYIEGGRRTNDVFTIAGIPVEEHEMTNFVGKLLSTRDIVIKGKYNNKYEIDTTIDTVKKRYSYKSISQCIQDHMIGLGMTLHTILEERGVKVKNNKD